jgi:transposase-like protein
LPGKRQEKLIVIRSTNDASTPASPSRETPEAQRLSQFLRQHMHALMSSEVESFPRCRYCAGARIARNAFQMHSTGRLPHYSCSNCGGSFNRLTLTPLGKRTSRAGLDALIDLLPQPLSYSDAGRRLRSADNTVRAYVRLFRRWLLVLDPRGEYERLRQLGRRLSAIRKIPSPEFSEAGAREDVALSTTLASDFDDIYSNDTGLPPCGLSGSRSVRRKGRHHGLPKFPT